MSNEEVITVWKVLTKNRRSAIVGHSEQVGKTYLKDAWVQRHPDLGPLAAFSDKAAAEAFVTASSLRPDSSPFTIKEAEAVLSEDQPKRRHLLTTQEDQIIKFWESDGTTRINCTQWPDNTILCEKIKCLE